jgi:hypothetical protein
VTGSSLAGIITALATLITALGGVIVTFKIMIPNKKTNEEAARVGQETHVIVNQQRTDMEKVVSDQANFIRALSRALSAHGIDIPIDQSKPDPEPESSGG